MADVELTSHLANIHRLSLKSECRIARNDMQCRDLAQVSDDVLANSIAEIFLLDVAADIRERQDADGKPSCFGRDFFAR